VLTFAGRRGTSASTNVFVTGRRVRRTLAEDCLLRALLRAAGLGRNTEPYAALADALDEPRWTRCLRLAAPRRRFIAPAVLLGMAGLLEQARAGEEVRATWARYRNYWPGRPLDARQWQRFRLRPANLPEARLAHSPQWWQVTDCADCWSARRTW